MNDNATGCEQIPRRSFCARLLHVAALLIILSAAAGLRMYGTTLYHPDEYVTVCQATDMAEHNLRPINFNYPSFYSTLLALVFKYLPPINTAIYGTESTKDVQPVYLRVRFVTAILGTLTVLIVYFTCCSMGWPTAGLAGAAFLAFSLNHSENSQYATVDVPMTFNAALASLFACMHYRRGRTIWAIMGGVCCGLTIGAKYNGAPILVPFVLSLLAVALRKRSFRAWLVVMAGLVSVPCGFLLANPYFISLAHTYIQICRQHMRLYKDGCGGYDNHVGPSNWVYNVTYLYRAGMGRLPTALAIYGAVAILFRPRSGGWLAVCFLLAYYAFISNQTVRVTRSLNVLTPFIAILAGYALWRVSAHILKFFGKRRLAGIAAVTLLTAVAFWQPFCLSLGYARMMRRVDPRNLAIEWAKANIPKNRNKIATDFLYGPRFPENIFRLTSYELGIHPLSWYLEERYDYIVTSSGYVIHWCPESNPKFKKFYDELEETFQVVATFPGNELGLRQDYYSVCMRPTITFYDLRKPRHSAVAMVSPVDQSSVDRSSCEIRWSFSDEDPEERQKARHLQLERYRGDIIELQAEALLDRAKDRQGWGKNSHIPAYSGECFITARRSSPALESTFSIETPGRYYCWVRYSGSGKGKTKATIGKLSTDLKHDFPTWWQELLGSAELEKGEHPIVISHTGEGDSIVDAFYLTMDPSFDPNKDKPWVPAIMDEKQSPETSIDQTRLRDLEPGLYRVRVKAENGKGIWGPWSPPVIFRLN